MNRIIKFRAWDNRKGSNTYGMNYDAQNSGYWFDFLNYPKYYTVQQFTGLKDSKGKDIYEGDITKYKSKIYKVDWTEWIGEIMFVSNESVLDITEIYYDEGEIIGNIFENPELLNISSGDKLTK